jgi:AraC-like DNA-binding protein
MDPGAEGRALKARNWAFRTDDLAQAVEFVTENFGYHSRVALGRGPLGFGVLAATSGRCTSGLSASAMPTVLRATAPAIAVHMPMHIGAEYRVGRRTLRTAQDVAVMLCPGHDYTVLTPPGETLAFLLEPWLLDREIDALGVRRPGCWVLKSMRLPLTPANSTALYDLVQRHGAAVTQALLTGRVDAVWSVEDELTTWLAQQVIAADGLVPLSPSNRRSVRRVDDWIRQHLSQPITLDQLRAAAGVSARTLQEACLAHWGRTPLELVAARRFEAVRSLLGTGAIDTVTEAAVRCGVSHLGRFSIEYRRLFGESPSDTLARAAAAPAPRSREARTTN